MQNPRVSVIISNYNYADFLETSIESVLHQTYADIDLIIVDDGSTDRSCEILRRYESRATIIHQDHQGETASRNAGFAVSSGGIVAFLDADDYWRSDAVERVLRIWKTEFAKVQFPLSVVDASGKKTGGRMPHCDVDEGWVRKYLLASGRYITSPTSGNFYSRKFLATIFPVPVDEWPQSMDSFAATYAGFDGRIGAVREELGFYRVHSQNMTRISGEPNASLSQIAKLMERGLRLRQLIQRLALERDLIADPNIVTGHWLYLKLELARLALTPEAKWRDFLGFSRDMLRSVATTRELTLYHRIQYFAWTIVMLLLPQRYRACLVQVSFELASDNWLARFVRNK